MLNFNDGETTPPETLSILLITVSTIISTTLDPLVYRYSTSRPPSVASFLFRILAVVDLTTCVLLPVHIFTTALHSEAHPEVLPNQYRCAGPGPWNCIKLHVSVCEKVRSVVVLALLISSLLVTSVMAICRWVQIVYPFKKLTIGRVAVYLIVGLLVSVFLQVYSLFFSGRSAVWVVQIMAAWTENAFNIHQNLRHHSNLLQITLVFMPFLFQVFGLVASVLTIREISKRQGVLIGVKPGQATKRGTVKIIATNFGNLLFVISHITSFILNNDHLAVNSLSKAWMNFSFGYLLPTALSALNPVIFLAFTPKALRYFSWAIKLGLVARTAPEEVSMRLRFKVTPVQRIKNEGNMIGIGKRRGTFMAVSPQTIYRDSAMLRSKSATFLGDKLTFNSKETL